MLTQQDQYIAKQFQGYLAQTVPILDLWVFGSRALGTATEESDFDFFIVVETITPHLRRRISEIAWEVGFELDRVISTVVATPNQIEHGAMGANPLFNHIQHEGIRI